MFKSGFVLDTQEKIEAAIFNRSKVMVLQKNKVIDYGRIIKRQDAETITVEDGHYIKSVCTLMIC